jgi:hypothetical protein
MHVTQGACTGGRRAGIIFIPRVKYLANDTTFMSDLAVKHCPRADITSGHIWRIRLSSGTLLLQDWFYVSSPTIWNGIITFNVIIVSVLVCMARALLL